MIRRSLRNIRPPAPRPVALILALCALLACTMSVPDFAKGTEQGNPIDTQVTAGLDDQPEETGTSAPDQGDEPGVTSPEATGPAIPGSDPAIPGSDPTAADATDPHPAEPDTTSSHPTDPSTSPAPTVSQGSLLVNLPWGEGPGQVGLARPSEGLCRGPEALAVADDGRIIILDSVNRRLVLLAPDGSFLANWPVELRDPRFLAVDARGVYVLDPDTDRQLVCLDWSGTTRARLALPALDQVVTALLATDRGLCIETGHDQVFLVDATGGLAKSTASGSKSPTAGRVLPAVTKRLAGRPLEKALTRVARVRFDPASGIEVRSCKVDERTLALHLLATARPRLDLGRAVEHLISVDAKEGGEMVIGGRLASPVDSPRGRAAIVLSRFKLTDSGCPAELPLASLYLDDRSFAYVGLPYVVASDGRVFQPRATQEGYLLLVHQFAAQPGVGNLDQASTPTPQEVNP